MRTQQLQGIIVLLAIIVSAIVYRAFTTSESVDPGLQQAQLTYETERIRIKQRNLRRYSTLKFYGTVGLLGAINLSLLILSGGYAKAKIKASSVHTAHIGKHSAIPVHHNDLQSFYPIAVNLSLAEIEASVSSSHEHAYQISRQMIEDITGYTRAIAGKRGLVASGFDQSESAQLALPAYSAAPTFAELLEKGTIGPGKPLVLGYSYGQPQYRSLEDLKSLAVAGWQGSGKTLSTAYLVASSVLAYGVHAYVIDPHKNHAEGLYSILKPLEKTGHVTIINPFDTPTLLQNLNRILDRRLAGEESHNQGILLVIDELARLAKMDCFDVLVTFLERCTEETRKANITFIGGSHKWTARHFKGRADIRGCMNSMLIHKTKPSQADLLVEDAHDKNLVKQIHRPGDAILSTDFTTPVLVSMPLCTRKDMEIVARLIKNTYMETPMTTRQLDAEVHPQKSKDDRQSQREVLSEKNDERENVSTDAASSKSKKPASTPSKAQRPLKGVIPFDPHLKKYKIRRSSTCDPSTLTLEQIQRQFQRRKQQEPGFTQAELARQSGLSSGHLSKILRGQQALNEQNKQKLYKSLFVNKTLETPAVKQ